MKKGIFLYLFSLIIFFTISHYSFAEANPKIIKNIEIKEGPLGMAIDENGLRLFVLNYSDGTLAVIDENNFSLIRKVSLNKKINSAVSSRSVAYDNSVNRIYVATGGDNVLGIDGENYQILIDIKDEEHKRFIPDLAIKDSYLYLLDWYGYIHKYNSKGKLDVSIDVKDFGASYMRMGPSDKLYVTSNRKGIRVIDTKKAKTVATIPVDALSIPEIGWNTAYVAGPGKLYEIDTKNLKVKKTIDIDYPPIGGLSMALNPNTGRLFLITVGDTVKVIDTKKMKKVDTLEVCRGPHSIAINKATNTVYVACPGDNRITVIKDE